MLKDTQRCVYALLWLLPSPIPAPTLPSLLSALTQLASMAPTHFNVTKQK